MHIVEVTEGKGALCAEILAALPQWFGIAESNAAYITEAETLPLFAARDGETTLGFLALKRHTPHACEILVMGIVPARHRQGAGRALIEAAAAYARGNGARFVTVKTLSPAHSDPGYARTRAFYEGLGFLAIEEFPTLWGAENPALLLVKPLG